MKNDGLCLNTRPVVVNQSVKLWSVNLAKSSGYITHPIRTMPEACQLLQQHNAEDELLSRWLWELMYVFCRGKSTVKSKLLYSVHKFKICRSCFMLMILSRCLNKTKSFKFSVKNKLRN